LQEKNHCVTTFSSRISKIPSQISHDGTTLKDFLDIIGEEGQLFTCIILTGPFLLPVSIPGSSIPFGLAIFLICVSIILNARMLLPSRIMNYNISKNNLEKILNGIIPIMGRIEKFINPRFLVLCSGSRVDKFNAALMGFCSLLLTLPLPVPLTDFLPAYSILFMALGSLECDGYLILIGYILTIITATYFTITAILGWDVIVSVFSFIIG
jgi:hypothetical protein